MNEQEKREKVIKGLECCNITDENECVDCPYYSEDFCVDSVACDAINLLKEYDAFCKWLAKDIMVNTDPDDDYYNPEVACRKLHKLGYVKYDKENNAWRVDDG